MVFCNTRRNTDKLARNLGMNGLHALAIHGGLTQNRRSEVLRAFHSRQTLILVCTDVAARGLDIKDVSHVYNFDLPKTGSDYIHRIGRTARAGKNGIGVSFVTSGNHGDFRQISREADLKIEKLPLPKFDILAVSSASPERNRPFRRGSNNPGNRQRRIGSRGRFSRGNSYRRR